MPVETQSLKSMLSSLASSSLAHYYDPGFISANSFLFRVAAYILVPIKSMLPDFASNMYLEHAFVSAL